MTRLGRREDPDLDVMDASHASADSDLDVHQIYSTTYPRLVRTLWFVVHDHEAQALRSVL